MQQLAGVETRVEDDTFVVWWERDDLPSLGHLQVVEQMWIFAGGDVVEHRIM